MDGATLPAMSMPTTNGKKAGDVNTGAVTKAAPPSVKKPRATPVKTNVKSEALISAGADTSDAEMGNHMENDNGAEADVDTPISTATPAANAAKKRSRKVAAAPELDAEGNPVTPAAKRARVQKKPELDSDGQPITPAKGGRKPKLDDEGNPIKPTPRVRKPKEQLDENGTPKPVRTRKAPIPKLDENGVEIPVNKGGRKSKAAIAAAAKAKAEEEAAMDAAEEAEQAEEAELATSISGVFQGKAGVHGDDSDTTILLSADAEETVVKREEMDHGGSEEEGMIGEADEDEEPAAEASLDEEV